MMTLSDKSKKVLVIDLSKKEAGVKSFPELYPYVGGMGLGLKLLSMYDGEDDGEPVIFSIGPLNGFFPYASKTSIVFRSNGIIEDIYLGGSLSFRMQFAGLDAIMILGKSEKPMTLCVKDSGVEFFENGKDVASLGLPGKRSTLIFDQTLFSESKITLDGYFEPADRFLEQKFMQKNIQAVVVTGTKTVSIPHHEKYSQLFNKLLAVKDEMLVSKGEFPSCSGCPMGCSKSKIGEVGGNVLVHSLCACSFATKIYSDVGTVFSCLNVLNYDYTHEDLENLPEMVNQVLKDLSA